MVDIDLVIEERHDVRGPIGLEVSAAGHRRAADEAVGPVDDDVILIAEHRDRDVGHAPLRPGGVLAPPGLQRPACICVLLHRLDRLIGPDLGRALARLDRPLLVIAVARRYQRRIDDLPAHRQIAAPAQLAIEGGKQIIDRPGPDQTLAKAPYGVAVRHRRTEIEAQEAKPAQAVADQKLHPLVAHRVPHGQDQNLEHRHRIVGRAAAFQSVRIAQRRLKRCAENLEVDDLRQHLQRIARRRKLAQMVR